MIYDARERLLKLNAELEKQVAERSRELENLRQNGEDLSLKDPLTAVFNRQHFLTKVDEAFQQVDMQNENIALLVLDLDHFKDINDSFGSKAGDMVLVEVARRLLRLLRPGDLLARLGGDEFGILYRMKDNRDKLCLLANRIGEVLEAPIIFENRTMDVGCSIGVSVAPGDTKYPNELKRFADIAMFHTKAQGGGDWMLYYPEMSTGVRERGKMTHKLRQALQKDALDVWYQPLIDLRTSSMVGVEALCRWHSESYGMISPTEFIPVAEETALIYELGDFVLQRACRDLKDWLEENDAMLSVNLSPKQLKDTHLLQRVTHALKTNRMEARHLCLEVTESLFLWDINTARERLNALSELGIRIALDDFGTGFSNLSQLRFLPIDILKIDRSFISDIDDDPKALALVRAIIAIAHSMNLETVAEGVETLGQALQLCSIGGEFAQGYAFAHPMTATELMRYVPPMLQPPAPASSEMSAPGLYVSAPSFEEAAAGFAQSDPIEGSSDAEPDTITLKPSGTEG